MIKNLYLPFLYAQNINSKIIHIYKSFNFQIYRKGSSKNDKNIKNLLSLINLDFSKKNEMVNKVSTKNKGEVIKGIIL